MAAAFDAKMDALVTVTRTLSALLDCPQEADFAAQMPQLEARSELKVIVTDDDVRCVWTPCGNSALQRLPTMTCGHDGDGLVFMVKCRTDGARSDLCLSCYLEAHEHGATYGALNCDCFNGCGFDGDMCLDAVLQLGRLAPLHKVMSADGGPDVVHPTRSVTGQVTAWRKWAKKLFKWNPVMTLWAVADNAPVGRQVREFLAREPRMATWTLRMMSNADAMFPGPALTDDAATRAELECVGKFVFGDAYQSEDEKFLTKYGSSGVLYWGPGRDVTCGKTATRDESEGDECLLCCGEFQGHVSCCGKPVCRKCYGQFRGRRDVCPWCVKAGPGMCVGMIELTGAKSTKKRGKEEASTSEAQVRVQGSVSAPKRRR